MVLNMKKLLAKIPGGSSNFATYSAALFLVKEETEENITEEKFTNFLLSLDEEVVNSVGSGHIAGVVNPPAAGKYQYWTNDKPVTSLGEFVEGASETKGSWWPYWLEWIKEQSDKTVMAQGGRVPGNTSYHQQGAAHAGKLRHTKPGRMHRHRGRTAHRGGAVQHRNTKSGRDRRAAGSGGQAPSGAARHCRTPVRTIYAARDSINMRRMPK